MRKDGGSTGRADGDGRSRQRWRRIRRRKYKELDKLKNKDQDIAMGFKQQACADLGTPLQPRRGREGLPSHEGFKDKTGRRADRPG
jgi:hypothetical protein